MSSAFNIPGEPSGWTRSAIFQAAKACAAQALEMRANSSVQVWQGHADNLNAIVDAIDAAAPPVDAVPGEPVALAREVLTAVRAAHPNPEPGSIGAKAIAAITGLDHLAAPVASRAGMEPVRPCILQEIEYANEHGWPQDSLGRLVAMTKAQRSAIAPAAPAEAKDAVRAEPECFYVRFAKEWITASEKDRLSISDFVEGWYQEDAAAPAPAYQQGYDKGISECAALGWKTPAPADGSGAGRLAGPETLRHSSNEVGDCPSWCKACRVEADQRAAEGGQA